MVGGTRSVGGVAAAVVVGVLAACDTPAPPAVQTSSVPVTAASAAAPVAQFDPGPVRTAAEYLAEPRFATADVSRGQLLSLACAACHSFNAAGGTLIGPSLHGVFGRRAASVAGFDYSPALASSALRLVLFAVPAYALSTQPGFQMRHIWYLGAAAVTVQMVLSVVLLHREFGRKLVFEAAAAGPVV